MEYLKNNDLVPTLVIVNKYNTYKGSPKNKSYIFVEI